MDSTRRPACSVRCPANCIRLLITVRILRRCIFFRPGASFFFNDSCPIKDAYVFRCIVAGIQPDEQWFSVSCLHSSMVSLRKSGVSFWQCCFPIRSSRLTRYPSVPIYAIIGAYPSNPCRYGIRLPYWISNCQRGLHQYRLEQSRYSGLSALCAFHAACRHLPAGCLCAGLIFLTKLLFPSICPTNTRPLEVMSRSSLNSMCIFFIALPPPVF